MEKRSKLNPLSFYFKPPSKLTKTGGNYTPYLQYTHTTLTLNPTNQTQVIPPIQSNIYNIHSTHLIKRLEHVKTVFVKLNHFLTTLPPPSLVHEGTHCI